MRADNIFSIFCVQDTKVEITWHRILWLISKKDLDLDLYNETDNE